MGYRVRQYSLDELRKIALPGAVVPSLFWALPVGGWDEGEVEHLWRHFTTERASNCFQFGLLLVADMTTSRVTAVSDLNPVGAALENLLPVGTDRYLGPRRTRDSAKQLLILSSAYPQPGWGVLVSLHDDRNLTAKVDQLVNDAINELKRTGMAEDTTDTLISAGNTFREWQRLKEHRPETTIPAELSRDLGLAVRAKHCLDTLKYALAEAKYDELSHKLIEFVNAIENPVFSGLTDAATSLRTLRTTIRSAGALLAIPKNTFSSKVAPLLDAIKRDPSQEAIILRARNDKSIIAAIHAGVVLHNESPDSEVNQLIEYATTRWGAALASLKETLTKPESEIQEKSTLLRQLDATKKADIDSALLDWNRRSSAARQKFYAAISNASVIQDKLAPQVLLAFESVGATNGFSARVIPWDPARMIGWKLQLGSIALTLHDLQYAARELDLKTSTLEIHRGNETETPIDGSYFTDYVHYIAVSKLGDSPRVVTQRLLASLLTPTQLRKLSGPRTDGENRDQGDDRITLADLALSHMGWSEEPLLRKTPVAGWLDSLKSTQETSLHSGKVVEVRKSVESLCKDILDIFAHKLGGDEDTIWEALQEQAPDYEPVSRRKKWDEEVDKLTIGPASIMISALGPLAFPDKNSDVKMCVLDLEELARYLNDPTHDRDIRGEPKTPQGLAGVIDALLKHCKALFGELPWHLVPSFSHGEQPKVICGEAWSHGHPIPRMLRVITSSDHPTQQEISLWNPTGANPVIANAVFLHRGIRL